MNIIYIQEQSDKIETCNILKEVESLLNEAGLSMFDDQKESVLADITD